ncbi:hypothetical protein [Methanobacterium sp.]|uniref:phenylacetate--CoA ligase family protein n=1 Tax=Methanobacterium sp. TaxID=2164 RepID=UPI0025E7C873|nr:hypothetical protein [Methanobacterium sp.]MBI5459245.1 phenylacetate--CoA ligase family protein [Methanobacterium sp.]
MGVSDSITFKALGLLSAYSSFSKTYNFLKESQFWSKDQLEEYQLNRLEELLHHSYENVPYYTRVFNERGIKPREIQDFNDLELLPFLTKELIRENLNDLKAKNVPNNRFEYVTTGGTSGVPLGFYYEKGVSRAIEWAFIKTLWDRVGYNFRDKCLILKGDTVESAKKGIFWKNTFFGRWLVLSSYHMTDANLGHYVEKIREFKPSFIQAYPSTITILAYYMQKNDIKPFESVKSILCGSENIYPHQRQLLEKVLDCRVYTWYGHSERTVLAGECEKSNHYHIFPEYGIFELVDDGGKKVKSDDAIGTIVGTGLTNYVMPLIRYKTDDLATYSTKKCKCQRNYQQIKDVKGRWVQEFIIANEHRLIPITALNMHSNVFDNVEQFQFHQDKVGEVILNIVKKPSYIQKDSEYIHTELMKKLGDLSLELKFVDEIPRTSRGKYRFLIQELNFN